MLDVRAWLEGLGLGQYAEAFADNDIDREVLRDLTEDDLEKIGVSLGHRKKLLKAIAAESDAGRAGEAAAPAAPARDAERRQITVMFCDLVGSTALSDTLDPEDLRGVMQAYQQAAGAVIDRYGGHVAQYLGDGLMTYFGFPHAHEDDAERAVRAGLEIVQAVKSVKAPAPLQVRVGIATGPVVVGETGAGDASVPKLAVGETPNLAARIQGLAGPDQVVIAPATRRLVGGAFALADKGGHTLKGIVEPVHAWRVAGVAVTEGRFEAAHGAHLTPFVGREAEVALLMEKWAQARDGEGQVALLCGEPGIGKSRIMREVRARIEVEPHTRLRYQCSPYHMNSALHPIIEQLARALAFRPEDDTPARLARLEALVGAGGNTPALFAALLNIETSDRYPALNMSPQKQKDETLKAIAGQVVMLAADKPVLMLFEDAHWIDPTSQETLDLIVPQLADKRVLLLITYRPEYQPPWPQGLGHVTTLNMSRLGRRQAAEMVARVTGGRPLPDEILDQIVAKTDGVPLFVEELTKTVIESGLVVEEDGAYRLTGGRGDLTVPATLQDSLMARLDRLSPVKEVAQIGACIGREFPHALLAAVSDLRDNELGDALQQLVNSELVFRTGTPPDATYSFKHALVQDAAYASLLKSGRHQLHGRIADTLLAEFPDRAAAEPELLGQHCEGAGRYAAAVVYFHRAAERAFGVFALAEAMAHGEKALDLIDKIEVAGDGPALELKVRTTLGSVYMLARGYADPSIGHLLRPAERLANSLGDDERMFTVLWALWVNYQTRSEYDEAMEVAGNQLSAARAAADDRKLVQAFNANAITLCAMGEFEKSHQFAEEMNRVYDFDRHHDIALANNNDPKCGLLSWDISCLWILGWPDRALRCWSEQLALALRLGHAFNLAFTYVFPTPPLGWMGRYEEARQSHEKALTLAHEHGFGFLESVADVLGGEILVAMGRYEEGLRRLESGLSGFRRFNFLMFESRFDAQAALAMAHSGRLNEARERIRRACDIGAKRKQGMYLAEIWRIRGMLDEMAGLKDDAQAAFQRAIDIAVGQHARSWELRAATSLARLWEFQGKRKKARELLAPVYGWFTEGFDTVDLKEAKALLDELQ